MTTASSYMQNAQLQICFIYVTSTNHTRAKVDLSPPEPGRADEDESGFWCAGREMPGRARRSPAGPTKAGGPDKARRVQRSPAGPEKARRRFRVLESTSNPSFL